ncbi:MAG: glutamyl-tRNA reductase [Eggerthellaceae bacterium]|nr:glutamyl-tRNA reductase [Eggerthellaceae bacterium]
MAIEPDTEVHPVNFFVVGLNHKTASVDLREQVAFTHSSIRPSLEKLCAQAGIYGAAILSTCNRTEIYLHAVSEQSAYEGVCSLFQDEKGLVSANFAPHLYTLSGEDAVRHLFEVVSSLDSMVLGEAQIAGQVKESFKDAQLADSTTMLLDRIFRQARSVGKRVRNQTTIGDSHVSLSTVAVDVAKETFKTLDDRSILLVGSGKMSELAARYLQEQGATSLIVASRTHAHAASVARSIGGEARYFDELPELIKQADIVLSSTASPHVIINPDMLKGRTKPLLILDLALPRDVDAACGEMEDVSLVDLDDLGTIAAMNQRRREDSTADARAIVEEEVALLLRWAAEHAVTPTIKEMRSIAEDVRKNEVAHLLKVLDADLSDDDRAALEAATEAIVKKMLHAPTKALRESVLTHTDYETVTAARVLFGLKEESESIQ